MQYPFQVVSAVDVAVGAADAWVDVMPLLPSVLSNADTSTLLHHLLTSAQKKGQWSNAQVLKQLFKIFVWSLMYLVLIEIETLPKDGHFKTVD